MTYVFFEVVSYITQVSLKFCYLALASTYTGMPGAQGVPKRTQDPLKLKL